MEAAPREVPRCSPAAARPCCRCGAYLCRGCRFAPRADVPYWRRHPPVPRPHLNDYFWRGSFTAMCASCEESTRALVERRFGGNMMSEEGKMKRWTWDMCDCDVWDRWICYPCGAEEKRECQRYWKDCVGDFTTSASDVARVVGRLRPGEKAKIVIVTVDRHAYAVSTIAFLLHLLVPST